MPQIDQPGGRVPDRHLPPVVLGPAGRALVYPPADTALHHDIESGLAGHGVIGRPPRADPRGPHGERVLGRAVHVERHPQRRGHDPGSSVLPAWPPPVSVLPAWPPPVSVLPAWPPLASVFSVFSASSRKRAAASPQTRSRYSRTASIPRSCRW